jgi:hypothetical protein
MRLAYCFFLTLTKRCHVALTPVALSLAGVAASVAKNAAIAVAVFAVGKFCYHPDSPFQIVQEAKKALQDGTLSNYLAKVDADGLARGLAGEWDQTLCQAILRICDASVAGSILARITDSDFLKSNPDSATDVLDLFNNAERLPVLIEVLKLGMDIDNLVDENGEDRFGEECRETAARSPLPPLLKGGVSGRRSP